MPALTAVLAAVAALALPAAAVAANDPLRPDQPNLSLVESDGARANSSTGKGAIVAIIDTGVQRSHPDLQSGRLLQGHDFVQNDADPQDGDGHGTHVLGIVGAAEAMRSAFPASRRARGCYPCGSSTTTVRASSPMWRGESTMPLARAPM